jgi:hypothetical protein
MSYRIDSNSGPATAETGISSVSLKGTSMGLKNVYIVEYSGLLLETIQYMEYGGLQLKDIGPARVW